MHDLVSEWIFYGVVILHGAQLAPVIWRIIRTEKTTPNHSHSTFISVIVCAHNEATHLPKLLPALLEQDYPHFEVLLVLDRCSDESLALATRIKDDRLKVLTVNEPPTGTHPKKHGIIEAIKGAAGKWLLLTDADCLPASRRWISSFASRMQPDVDLVLGLGAYTSNHTLVGAITQYETFQTAIHYTAAALTGKAYMGVGRNLAYRKDTFLKNDGFSPFQNTLGGDDDLLVQKLATETNTVVNFEPQSLTYSYPKRTWREYIRQKTRHFSVGKHYLPQIKRNHMIRMSLHAMLWLSWLYLICFFPEPKRIIVLFGLLLLVKGLFFKKIAYQIGLPFQLRWIVLLDFCYAVFLPLIGIRARFERTTRWK